MTPIDPDDLLAATVEAFLASGDDVWHVDRHVWWPLDEPELAIDELSTRFIVCRRAV